MNKKAFTLIELLIVIGIIAILASAVIVAINPGQQFAAARDATRERHIKSLHNSLTSYQISNQGWGDLEITDELTEICNTNEVNTEDCGDLADISDLVDDGHINQIPVDPRAEGDGTGYFIKEGSIILVADRAETGFIGIGITEDEFVGDYTASLTNCGAEGRYGPSQEDCDAEYGEKVVSVVGDGIQEWTVPYDGTYKITAYGAEGGDSGTGKNGGNGVKMSGEFELEEGKELEILVGQQGESTSSSSGGGGGGTFVTKSGTFNSGGSESDIYVIAGGGGGAGGQENGRGGTTDEDGLSGTGGAYDAGTNGDGATYSESDNDSGSGGGGLLTDGESIDSGCGGKAYVNGGDGGESQGSDGGEGGFGGGASGGEEYSTDEMGGGGGGGYSGGAGGEWDNGDGAGGGGSYNDGNNQSNSSGANTGHGEVVIEKIE